MKRREVRIQVNVSVDLNEVRSEKPELAEKLEAATADEFIRIWMNGVEVDQCDFIVVEDIRGNAE